LIFYTPAHPDGPTGHRGDGIQTYRSRGQNDLEFLIPGDSDTYIDLDIKLYVRGKIVSSSGKDVDLTDTSPFASNLLQSLFSQCTVMVNGVPVTQSHEHYNYRAYLEILFPTFQMLPPHICLTLIGTLIPGICSLEFPRQRRTLPPQTTDS
jgi:hypothetical protein